MPFRILAILVFLLSSPADAFDLQGHRGTRGLAPENTLPAFATALSMGVTTLELDTAITKDGVMVIGHDPALNPDIVRGPDGKWLEKKGPPIHELTYSELRKYDIGRINPASEYAKRHPDQMPVDGTRYACLSELFALVRKARNSYVRFNIETKTSPEAPDETVSPEAFTRQLIAEIRWARMSSRVTIQSFDWRTLAIAQREAPDIPTVYLSIQQKSLDTIGTQAGESPWTAALRYRDYQSVPKMVKAAGGKVWSPFFRDVDEANLQEAHDLGLAVVVWTVNEPEQIARMLDMGVDGIISDRPDRVREEMRKGGMPMPKGTAVRP
jgi:glycerophosphoryl diester phosphodiesterase